ncbi:MAG: glutathione S-transferase N-terminal domain-containing protein [Pseudomonadota bacterium]
MALTTTKPVLWGRGSSTNVQKVLWTAYELGIEFDRRIVGGPAGGNDTPEFLAMNPNGKVPVWQDGDFIVWESHAIMRHLARNQGRLYGDNPVKMAKADQWLDWYASVFWPPIRHLFLSIYNNGEVPNSSNGGNEALASVRANLALIEGSTHDGLSMDANRLTLPHIALAIGLNRLAGVDFGVELPSVLASWHQEVRSRSAFHLATADEPDLPGHKQRDPRPQNAVG